MPQPELTTPKIDILETKGVEHLGKAGIAFVMALHCGDLSQTIPEAAVAAGLMIAEMLRQGAIAQNEIRNFFSEQH